MRRISGEGNNRKGDVERERDRSLEDSIRSTGYNKTKCNITRKP
jgi:hypothetical protein